MKKIKLFKIINTVFRLFLIFLISFVWIKYFFNSFKLSIILSCVATIFVDFTIRFFSEKKNEKEKIKIVQKEKIENYINSFVFNDDKYALDFFYKLALSRHNADKKRNFILINHPNSKIVLIPYYTYRCFDTDDLIYVYNQTKNFGAKKIIVCVNEIDPSAEKLAQKLSDKLILLNGEQTYYQLMEEYDMYPDEMPSFKNKELIGWKELFSYALNKKRTRGYFFTSLILLFSSFIVKYNIYYVVMSSLLLILSLVSFINPKFNKVKVEEKLLY